MPKMIESERERRERLAALPPLSWPYNRREQLPKGHGRTLQDSSAYCPGYKNLGQFPGLLGIPGAPLAPFTPARNRASRRRSGNYGHGHRLDYQPRTSPRIAPYVSGGRQSVTLRAARRIGRMVGLQLTDWQARVLAEGGR